MPNQTRNNSAKFVFSSLVDINSNKQGRYDFIFLGGEGGLHGITMCFLKQHVEII